MSFYFVLKNLPWKGIVLALVGILSLFFSAQQWILGEASLNWPKAQGEIVVSEAIACTYKLGNRRHHGYRVRIIYEYSVNGVLYSSKKITYANDLFIETCGDAQEVMTQYPLGKAVLVHYSPKNPKISVLRPGGTSFISIGFSMILLILGAKSLMGNGDSANAKAKMKKLRIT
jgi:hypothetical protein